MLNHFNKFIGHNLNNFCVDHIYLQILIIRQSVKQKEIGNILKFIQ